MWLAITVAIVLLLLWYVLEGRAWLKTKRWADRFFALIEPLELKLYQKSETLLAGRLLSIGGFIVSAYDAVALMLPQLNLTPVTNRLLANVPEDLRGTVISGVLMALGLLISWLRKRTTKPLEMVALPDELPPAVAAKVELAEQLKEEAVAAVQDARAEGAV